MITSSSLLFTDHHVLHPQTYTDLQVSWLTETRRKVTQSQAFQYIGKSGLFWTLREIWVRFFEESQLWLSSKHQTWGKSPMDRRAPERAMADGRWQRTAVGHPLCWDEGAGCSGWLQQVLEGQLSLPWPRVSFLPQVEARRQARWGSLLTRITQFKWMSHKPVLRTEM